MVVDVQIVTLMALKAIKPAPRKLGKNQTLKTVFYHVEKRVEVNLLTRLDASTEIKMCTCIRKFNVYPMFY